MATACAPHCRPSGVAKAGGARAPPEGWQQREHHTAGHEAWAKAGGARAPPEGWQQREHHTAGQKAGLRQEVLSLPIEHSRVPGFVPNSCATQQQPQPDIEECCESIPMHVSAVAPHTSPGCKSVGGTTDEQISAEPGAPEPEGATPLAVMSKTGYMPTWHCVPHHSRGSSRPGATAGTSPPSSGPSTV